jgi:nicotinate-nucleotide adenylyltransferase
MNIGLYFGSFNPVHTGHLGLAGRLLDDSLVDELWFVLSPCNPLKKQADLLDEHIRLKMLELAIGSHPKMKASDVEFDMPLPSYTIDTLRLLSKQYQEHKFSLLIGSDNALAFDKWKDYRAILSAYPVWVYPRRGYDFQLVAEKYPQMQLLPTPYYDVSSTEIRKRIAQKKDAGKWLHPSVYQFISENGLYSL